MPRTFTSDSPTIEEIMRLKKPNVRSVDIALDPQVKHDFDEAMAKKGEIEDKLNKLSQKRKDLADSSRNDLIRKLEEAEKKIGTLYEALEESTVTFKFKDIGRKNFDDLVTLHPPTEDQVEEYKAELEKVGLTVKDAGGLNWNPETFVPALLAACSLEPKISHEYAVQIMEQWSDPDIESMFLTALKVCKEKVTVPFSKSAIEGMRDSGLNSTIAPNEESPTANS